MFHVTDDVWENPKITYKYEDGDNVTTVEFRDCTWPELVGRFAEFIRGCGFIVTTEEVEEQFAHKVKEFNDANEKTGSNDFSDW